MDLLQFQAEEAFRGGSRGGGGGGSGGSGPFGGPPNFIKREKTSRVYTRTLHFST